MTMMADDNQTTISPGIDDVENCTDGSQAVWNSLGMCLENALHYLAFLAAIASLGFWLVSHLFLLRARHVDGNASWRQFLSLVHIFSANLCNVIGARLSGQLGTQVIIACYFVGTDFVFFVHFIFMRCTSKPRLQADGIPYSEWKSPARARGKQNGSRTRVMCLLLAWLPAMVYMPLASSPWQQNRMQRFGPGRKLMMVSDSAVDNFGFTLGVIAIFIYGLAKVPLIKDGLRQNEYLLRHFRVINFAVLANICYVLSIILYSQDLRFMLNALPWLLICGVCTLMDVIIAYLIARQHRRLARERAAQHWEESRDPRVREYEDGKDYGTGLQDEGDEVWEPQQQPKLAAIDEDEEDQESDEQPHRTQADLTYSDSDRGVGHYTDEEVTGQRSPIQALPPPPQHPRGGRRQKAASKARDEGNAADDLEWDLSDMSKTYKEDDEADDEDVEDEDVVWDEEVIMREVEAELRRREGHGTVDPHADNASDISVQSLEFEDIPVDEDVAEGMQDEWFES